MLLSYVIVTHNRREPLVRTLRHLFATTPYTRDRWEVWVVDNASTDGTEQAMWTEFPHVNYLKLDSNDGVGARSRAFPVARGKYVILLDDDSYPIDDAVEKSIDYLEATPGCAGVIGKVVLPDGSQEGSAFPAVMLSGAVCLRREVLLTVGGFRREFFRKAGEYDVSFRIWQAGYTLERFEDVVYRHDKVLTGRSKAFAHRMDLRNNLILVERYLPAKYRPIYRQDVTQRYSALARAEGFGRAVLRARFEAACWRLREMVTGRQTVSDTVVETLYQLDRQAGLVARFAKETKAKSVVIADLSKNLYATYQACRRAGLTVLAVADDNPAYRGLHYRSVPVLTLEAATKLSPDAVVLSNINPAQCREKAKALRSNFACPVLQLWEPSYVGTTRPAESSPERPALAA